MLLPQHSSSNQEPVTDHDLCLDPISARCHDGGQRTTDQAHGSRGAHLFRHQHLHIPHRN